ncbi:hypothetical protein KDL01_20545, partial [Actinospica durhamensis]
MKQAGRLAAALGVAVSCVVVGAPSAFAADVTVRPADLAAGTSWVVSPFNTDVAEIGALADPIHFDGSAHLQVAAADQRAQLALPLDASLAHLEAEPLSYQIYVDPRGSDPNVVASGVSLQLQVSSPTFTTLSFQPQNAGGAVAGEWRTFTNADAPLWRTSRAFGHFAAGSDHSLADYIDAVPQSQVNAAFLNVGTGAAELNAYTDNVAIDGDTYNFATTGSAHASITAPPTLDRRTPTPIALSFSSDPDGPEFRHTSALFTVTGPDSLNRRDLIALDDNRPLPLEPAGTGTFSAHVALSGDTLRPGEDLTADLSLILRRRAPCGTYVVSGRLLTDDTATNLTASQTLTLACPTT